MYWVHRMGIGRRSDVFDPVLDVPAMCYLLEKRNCLTVGWNCFSNDANIVNAVKNGNSDLVMNLMLNAGKNWTPDPITRNWARSLVNFTKMQVGDIVVVLPNKNYVSYFFVVEIESVADSILNSPSHMIAPFNVDGVSYNFSSTDGWTRTPVSTSFDVGFFHEVKLLTNRLPRNLIGNIFDYVRSTNAPIKDDNWRQAEIKSLILNEGV